MTYDGTYAARAEGMGYAQGWSLEPSNALHLNAQVGPHALELTCHYVILIACCVALAWGVDRIFAK